MFMVFSNTLAEMFRDAKHRDGHLLLDALGSADFLDHWSLFSEDVALDQWGLGGWLRQKE